MISPLKGAHELALFLLRHGEKERVCHPELAFFIAVQSNQQLYSTQTKEVVHIGLMPHATCRNLLVGLVPTLQLTRPSLHLLGRR